MVKKQQKPSKNPLNFWLKGRTKLVELPEIKRGLVKVQRIDPALKAVHTKKGAGGWKKQPEGFEGLLNIILAQQISTAVATHMVARMKTLLPRPSARQFLTLKEKDLREIGMSRQKISYAQNLAEQIERRTFKPAQLKTMPEDEAMEMITALKGFGPWSAEIYLMFSLGRGNIWPAGDIALQKGLKNIFDLDERPDYKHARTLGTEWAPHRSAAALIVWRA